MNKEQLVAIIQGGHYTDGDLADAILAKLNSAEPVAFISGFECQPNGDLNCKAWSCGNYTTPLFTHPPAPSAVDGYQIVPLEPSRDMLDAAHIDLDREAQIDVMLKYVWKQMLSAARSE